MDGTADRTVKQRSGWHGIGFLVAIATSAGAFGQSVVTGSGTPGKVPVWTDVTTVGDSAITQSETNVGIGTDTPQFTFDVSAANGIKLGLEGSGGGQLRLGNNPNDNSIYFEGFSTDGTDSANSMLFTGRLGRPLPYLQFIGTHDVFWTGSSGQVRIEDLSDRNHLNIRPNAGNGGWLSLTEDSVADRWVMGIRPADDHLYFAIGNPISNANRVIFASNGDISTTGAVGASTGFSVAGQPVINGSGRWVGDLTGLQGPPGATGPQGPAGPTGPAGPAVHTSSLCYVATTACNLACAGRVVASAGFGGGNCTVTSDSGTCTNGGGIGWCCVCSP